MKNLEEINETISEINYEIDRLLNEQVVTGINWLAKYLVSQLEDKKDDIINIYDKSGNIYKQIEKNPLSVLDDLDVDNVSDVTNKKEIDPEMSALMAKMEKAVKDSKKNIELNSGSVKDSNVDDTIFKKSNRKIYETITINFRGINELSVIIGSGQELKQRISGVIVFDIVTIKETGLGYIMNLKSKNFNRDVNLLLYARNLKNKPQTNKLQLIYKSGKFVGLPTEMTFEVLSKK